ncbi:MAG: RidA family protein [Proteobacteria bacterium]|nr:RidA family protein [Pseudomonadota bacterium]
MSKKIIETKDAPSAIGPYSQAVTGAGLIFVSGQIPLDPETGEISGANIKEQTDRVMKNLDAVLTAGGSNLGKVVKTTIYLSDMDDFPVVNDIYGGYFNSNPPARATVEVSRLPKGVLVEIDAVALAA